LEIGKDDTDSKRRCVDLATKPDDRVTPVQDCGVFLNGPAVWHVGGKDELEEAEVGEAVGRDGVSEEI
jgi:hypothetical protein